MTGKSADGLHPVTPLRCSSGNVFTTRVEATGIDHREREGGGGGEEGGWKGWRERGGERGE